MTAQEPQEPKKSSDKSNKEDKIIGLYDYAKTNTKDTISYLILVIGIVLLFFRPFLGGLLIGIITGIYFGKEIFGILRNSNEFIEKLGIVRSFVLGITMIAFFISAPGIFIGSALALGLKYLLETGETHKIDE